MFLHITQVGHECAVRLIGKASLESKAESQQRCAGRSLGSIPFIWLGKSVSHPGCGQAGNGSTDGFSAISADFFFPPSPTPLPHHLQEAPRLFGKLQTPSGCAPGFEVPNSTCPPTFSRHPSTSRDWGSTRGFFGVWAECVNPGLPKPLIER